jgi:hypothetical protein
MSEIRKDVAETGTNVKRKVTAPETFFSPSYAGLTRVSMLSAGIPAKKGTHMRAVDIFGLAVAVVIAGLAQTVSPWLLPWWGGMIIAGLIATASGIHILWIHLSESSRSFIRPAFLGGVVSAGGVGFDISCGVRTMLTGLKIADILPVQAALPHALYRQISAGVGSRGPITLDASDMDAMLVAPAQLI